jgi:hypothetical protein
MTFDMHADLKAQARREIELARQRQRYAKALMIIFALIAVIATFNAVISTLKAMGKI